MAIDAQVSTLDQDPQMQWWALRAYSRQRAFTMVHECMNQISSATRERSELGEVRDRLS